MELQAAISQVEDDKEEHLDQLKAASSFAALSIWLKQAMGMRIEGLSRWEAAVNHLEMATNLMVQLEQQAGSFVEWWVIMDNTFRAAAGSIQDLNTNRYPKGRMEGLENELGAMKDALLQHQLAVCSMIFQLLSVLIKSSVSCPVGSPSGLLFSLIRRASINFFSDPVLDPNCLAN